MNHFSVSIIKSVLRIVGCAIVIANYDYVKLFAVCFLAAEILGIVEEFVDKRKEV